MHCSNQQKIVEKLKAHPKYLAWKNEKQKKEQIGESKNQKPQKEGQNEKEERVPLYFWRTIPPALPQFDLKEFHWTAPPLFRHGLIYDESVLPQTSNDSVASSSNATLSCNPDVATAEFKEQIQIALREPLLPLQLKAAE